MLRDGTGGTTLKRSSLRLIPLLAGIAVASVYSHTSEGGNPSKALAARDGRAVVVAIPVIDSARGGRLFVTKGCVICHSVNRVGGKAGPALDAPEGKAIVDIFGFAARMWAGAFAMIELQGMELGYQLEIDGEELGHIAAFVYDKAAQRQFTQSDVPDLIKDMIIREPYEPGKGLEDPRQ